MSDKYGIVTFNNPKDSGGFFSNYFSVLSTIGMCMHRNLVPYVDASNTWFNPTCNFETYTVGDSTINPWSWWFQQREEGTIEGYRVPIFRGFIDHNPLDFANQPNLPPMREIAAKHCKVKPHIAEEMFSLQNKYSIGEKTLGILARGTEMLHHHLDYPKVQLETWPDIIKNYLEEIGEVEKIFVVSDDKEIIDTISNAFDNVVYLEGFFRRTHQPQEALRDHLMPWWLTSPTGDPNHRKRLGEECLIQAGLLARCEYFLGTHSGISNAVHFFNNNTFRKTKLV